jgi:PEP-CTERM motif
MSIASRMFLAAAFAAGFLLPGGGQAAVQDFSQGFSIDLGDPGDPLTLDYNAAGGLSAEVAASNGQPAQELPNNGSYKATLTGNYDVVDDLASLDKNKPVLWQESYIITLNGRPLFGGHGIIGPESPDDIWQAFLFIFNKFTGLPSGDLNVIIAVLEHRDSLDTMGKFDYLYNTLNQPAGTFAVGTTEDLGSKIALSAVNTISFDFSAFVVPEPSTWAMLLLGFVGLGFVGYRRRATPRAA